MWQSLLPLKRIYFTFPVCISFFRINVASIIVFPLEAYQFVVVHLRNSHKPLYYLLCRLLSLSLFCWLLGTVLSLGVPFGPDKMTSRSWRRTPSSVSLYRRKLPCKASNWNRRTSNIYGNYLHRFAVNHHNIIGMGSGDLTNLPGKWGRSELPLNFDATDNNLYTNTVVLESVTCMFFC